MTGLTATFTPGSELRCAACEFRLGDLTSPSCLIAIEMADDGERMTSACCPEMHEGACGLCPVCGTPGGGCASCLIGLRLAS